MGVSLKKRSLKKTKKSVLHMESVFDFCQNQQVLVLSKGGYGTMFLPSKNTGVYMHPILFLTRIKMSDFIMLLIFR